MSIHPGTLTIDLAALAANYGLIQKKVGPSCIAAGVVKADGYGLGMERVAGALAQKGCGHFFVATPEEGVRLRAALPEARIAILDGLFEGEEKLYEEKKLIPVIGSLEALSRAGGEVILHFDTGMNRLGFGPDETQTLLTEKQRLAKVKAAMVMSHFACSDENHELNEIQFQRFEKIAAHFQDAKKSLCNSSGVFRDQKYHFDIVRPGVSLYGVNPVPGQENPVRPVVRLEVRVLQIRNIKKGETVGYGATYVFNKDTQTATVALGYADGFLRSQSNNGYLFWQGHPLPIRGRVSMDLTCVDLGALPEDKRPKPGDRLEVIGENQSVDDVANNAGTIGYEILTSLGHRYQRVYSGS